MDPQQRLQQLYSQDMAKGTGDYTNLESAYRVLDEGSRSGLSLDEIGASFGFSPERTNQVLSNVGIDPSSYGSSMGLRAMPSTPQGAMGIGSLAVGQDIVPTVQQNLVSMYDPAQSSTAGYDLAAAQRVLSEGARAGLNVDQIGAAFNMSPEATRRALIDVGVDTDSIPGFQEGGAVDTGEKSGFLRTVGRGISGLADYAKDVFTSDVPEALLLKAETDDEHLRFTGRPGSSRRDLYYGEGPTFEERLIEDYGYPESPERSGSANFSRDSRPTGREDMPAVSELLDARMHALGSALYAKEYGPEASAVLGAMGEFVDGMSPLETSTKADRAMDNRNNAVGRKIMRNAGIMNTPKDMTKMVDQAILDQLDRIMDRPVEDRRAESPKEGIDVYFPRRDFRTGQKTTSPQGVLDTFTRH